MAAYSFGGGLSLDPMAEVQAAGEAGKKRGLAQLYGKAYNAAPGAERQSLLAKMAGVDGEMAMSAQGSFDKQDGDVNMQMAQTAKQVAALWKANPQMAQQLYATRMLPLSARAGIQAPPTLDESLIPGLSQLGAIGDGAGESYTLSPGAKRFGPNGELLAEAPFSPDRPQNASFQVDAEGQGWWLAPGQAPQRADMPGASAPQGQQEAPQGQPAPQGADVMGGAYRDSGNLADSISSLVSPLGGRITSTTGGKHNTGSKHYSGNAVDIGMGRESPEQQAQILAALQADPSLIVRDERTRPPGQKEWSGPHLHTERRGQQVAQAGGIRFPTKAAAGKPAPSGWQWNADQTALEPMPGGPADRKNNPMPVDQAKGEMSMRKEVSDRVKQSREVMTMYQKVQGAATKPSAPNDLALIFAYMKMLDPGSVVREQEFANAQNAAGVPDQVKNAYNKALSGERLNPNQRQAFLQSAQQIAGVASQQVTQVAKEYQGMADAYGYDANRATGLADFRNVQSGGQAPATPNDDPLGLFD